MHKIINILGLYLAYVPKGGFIGNCFSPALVLERFNTRAEETNRRGTYHYSERLGRILFYRPARAKLTIRTGSLETTIYWRGGSVFDWNSDHLAVRFGERHEAPHGDIYLLESKWLGNHSSI